MHIERGILAPVLRWPADMCGGEEHELVVRELQPTTMT